MFIFVWNYSQKHLAIVLKMIILSFHEANIWPYRGMSEFKISIINSDKNHNISIFEIQYETKYSENIHGGISKLEKSM